MNPTVPEISEFIVPPPERQWPPWGWKDIALFIGGAIPALGMAAGVTYVVLGRSGLNKRVPSTALTTPAVVAFQVLMYALMILVLWLIIRVRHDEPFWSSLRWSFSSSWAWKMIALGPVLAIGLSISGALLGMREGQSEVEDLITGRSAFVLMTLLGAVFAPAFEEILFRGFLFPVTARTFGPWLGAVVTALPFGLLHGAQNHWAWQPLVLITLAGLIFGIVRFRTGSTLAAFLLHAAYNTTQFLMFAVARWNALTP